MVMPETQGGETIPNANSTRLSVSNSAPAQTSSARATPSRLTERRLSRISRNRGVRYRIANAADNGAKKATKAFVSDESTIRSNMPQNSKTSQTKQTRNATAR